MSATPRPNGTTWELRPGIWPADEFGREPVFHPMTAPHIKCLAPIRGRVPEAQHQVPWTADGRADPAGGVVPAAAVSGGGGKWRDTRGSRGPATDDHPDAGQGDAGRRRREHRCPGDGHAFPGAGQRHDCRAFAWRRCESHGLRDRGVAAPHHDSGKRDGRRGNAGHFCGKRHLFRGNRNRRSQRDRRRPVGDRRVARYRGQ